MITSIYRYNNTRIAPTPSGLLHIGNVLSFAITSALAQKSGAKVLLRIDDLDQLRTDDRYLQDIFDTLNYLEIHWDKGPGNVREFREQWSQMHRMDLYNAVIRELSDKGLVFACRCSRQQMRTLQACPCFEKKIPLNAENASLRLITGAKELFIRSYDGRLIAATPPPEMKNFIIRRKDGIPSYQLTSVVDDLYFNIDLVIRGQDMWPSTIAQHMLASALEEDRFDKIAFCHHPLLVDAEGKKLSKSAGSTSVRYLRENGKKPSDIYAIIGQMIAGNEKIQGMDELLEAINSTFNAGK